MNISTLKIGRIIFAIPFLIFGLFHFMNTSAMAAMVPIPGGVFWVYLTGVAHLAAAIAILINRYARLACQLLGVMLFIFALSIHLPSVIGGNMDSMTNLLKDIALGGAAWAIADTFVPQAGPVEA